MVSERENGTADIWQMPEGSGYPELTFFSNEYQPHILDGDGTPDNPYKIITAEDLGAINHYDLLACYKLIADIDLSDITWSISPIAEFNGMFDGSGHQIRYLKIESHKTEYVGLFGKIGVNCRIRDLGLEDVLITGLDNSGDIGGLAGYSNGNINNCHVTGRISGGNDSLWLGLLVGENSGNITNCYTAGSISFGNDSGDIGGLVGVNAGFILNSYSIGTVSCGENSRLLGGLVGWNIDKIYYCYADTGVFGGINNRELGGLVGENLGVITNCYSTGAVSGADGSHRIGGLIGKNYYSDTSNCYSTSTVKGGNNCWDLGGFVGFNRSGIISYCYAGGNVISGNESENLGGFAGNVEDANMIEGCYFRTVSDGNELINDFGVPLTDEQMKQQDSFVGWDFDEIWMICEGIDYPRLQFQEIQCGE
jgi:hypothetical protein